jgi:hypothetical protein
MWIPDTVADPDTATQKLVSKFELLIQSSISYYKNIKIFKHFVAFQKSVSLKNFLYYYLASGSVSASAKRFFPGSSSASAFFYADPQH